MTTPLAGIRTNSPRRRDAAFAVLLALICLAVYWQTLSFGITNADDEVLVSGNLPFLRNSANLLRVFTTDAFYLHKEIDLYRPLQSLTFLLDAQWGGDVVFHAHLTNLLLHIACAITVYFLLLRLEFRRGLAMTGSLVYGVHYLFMTAVAWIPARGDLLLTLWILLALLFLIRSLERPGWPVILAHLACYSLALLSKESGVMLPLLVVLYLWSHDRLRCLTRRHLLLPIGYVVVGAAYWWLKSAAVADSAGERGLGPLLKNLWLLPETVAKLYLPLNMSTLPAPDTKTTLVGVALILLLTAFTAISRSGRQRRVLFYPGWFLLFILPGMTYYPNFYAFTNEHVDHRSYLICFGLLLLNLHLLGSLALERRRWFPPLVIAGLVYLAAVNIRLATSYRDPERFALKAITMGSDSALAYTNYGAERFLRGDELQALTYLNRALQMVDRYLPALHYRARIFANRGMNREALADLDRLLATEPAYDAADYGLRGAIRVRLGDDAGAEQDFREALRLDPALAEAGVALGKLLFNGGRLTEACAAWKGAAASGSAAAAGLMAQQCRP